MNPCFLKPQSAILPPFWRRALTRLRRVNLRPGFLNAGISRAWEGIAGLGGAFGAYGSIDVYGKRQLDSYRFLETLRIVCATVRVSRLV